MYDVIVVGMGPAGATAAGELSRAGFSVLGLEWKTMPRYKVCGGGLSARLDALLDPDYRSTIEDTIYSVRFQFAGMESFRVTSPDPIAYMVMRDRFDAELVRQARTRGVEIHDDERVEAVTEHYDSVDVRTARGHYRARIVIGADGATSMVGRSLCAVDRGPLMSGVEGEAVVTQRPSSLPPGTILLDIGMLKGGYAWVFPKRGNLSIGAAEFQERRRSAKDGYVRFLREEAILAGLAAPTWRGHAIPLYANGMTGRGKLTSRRALLVGDAAHLVDPLFGEGIYYAVLSGKIAAECISDRLAHLAPDLLSYERRVADTMYPEFQVAARIAWILYTFPRVFHRLIRRRPDIVELFYDVLKGRDTYQGFYSKAKGEATTSLVGLFTTGPLKHSGV